MALLDFLKKKAPEGGIILIGHDETDKIISEHFDERAFFAIQGLWDRMISMASKENKVVVSIPYNGMLFIAAHKRRDVFDSPEFLKIVNENSDFTEGRDLLRNYYMKTPANHERATSSEEEFLSGDFLSWNPRALNGEYFCWIILNLGSVYRHCKAILKEEGIKCNDGIENFYHTLKIRTDDGVVLDIRELTGSILNQGMIIDQYGPFIVTLHKHMSGKADETRYLGKPISEKTRLRAFLGKERQ